MHYRMLITDILLELTEEELKNMYDKDWSLMREDNFNSLN